MKNSLVALLLTFLSPADSLSGLHYEVYSGEPLTVKIEKLQNVASVGEIIPYYPANWIEEYVSVEVMATSDDKSTKAVSPDDKLNAEQKRILKTLHTGHNIHVTVAYRSRNSVTNEMTDNNMHASMVAVPEIRAQYPGGEKAMLDYFRENFTRKIPEEISGKLLPVQVQFTISREGAAGNVRINNTTGDKDSDALLRKVVGNMPKWKPARNSKGTNVTDVFRLKASGAAPGC